MIFAEQKCLSASTNSRHQWPFFLSWSSWQPLRSFFGWSGMHDVQAGGERHCETGIARQSATAQATVAMQLNGRRY